MFMLLDLYRQKDGLDEEFLLSANYNETMDITAGARAPAPRRPLLPPAPLLFRKPKDYFNADHFVNKKSMLIGLTPKMGSYTLSGR